MTTQAGSRSLFRCGSHSPQQVTCLFSQFTRYFVDEEAPPPLSIHDWTILCPPPYLLPNHRLIYLVLRHKRFMPRSIVASETNTKPGKVAVTLVVTGVTLG